jgi:hypothetical protein
MTYKNLVSVTQNYFLLNDGPILTVPEGAFHQAVKTGAVSLKHRHKKNMRHNDTVAIEAEVLTLNS